MCQNGFEHFVGLSLVRDKALETTEAQITELLASANVVGLIDIRRTSPVVGITCLGFSPECVGRVPTG